MVKSFRDYLAEVQANGDKVEEVFVFYHFGSSDTVARFLLSQMLTEEKRYVDLGGGREIYFHKAHVTPGHDHLHFYQNNSKLYALNRDGTAHDKSHGAQMARWAQQGVKDHYPDFTVPPGGLIEAMFDGRGSKVLTECFGTEDPLLVPEAVRAQALIEARRS